MPAYEKTFLTFDQQLTLIEIRGLHIRDREAAQRDLQSIGYYRLSAYWYSWRKRARGHREGIDIPSDEFEPGYAFEDAVSFYTFDRHLRLLLMDAIERLEVAIRVQVAYQTGMRGAFSHLDRNCLGPVADASSQKSPSMTRLEEFREKLSAAIQDSPEAFANHFRLRYDGAIPIWAAIELWDFGTLSRFYQMCCWKIRRLLRGSLASDLTRHSSAGWSR